jgi:hypothetical protein
MLRNPGHKEMVWQGLISPNQDKIPMKLRQAALKLVRAAWSRQLMEAANGSAGVSVTVGLNHSPEAMQHPVPFGKHRGDTIPRAQSRKRAGLFDVIRPHCKVQTSDQARAANCDRSRCGVGPDHCSDDQVFHNGVLGRRGSGSARLLHQRRK